jgi:glycosyltransferase involved in cell wall biosynthesis
MSDSGRGTVSVIIPAYNAAAYVGRAVESALSQTYLPLEILVIDDGSSDETAEIVEQLPAPVRLIRKTNGGPATARNLGARQAQGDWLALLDADDLWMPDKLRVQLEYGTNPDVGMVHCLPDHRDDAVPPQLTFEHLWNRNWIINSSVLLRRSAFDGLGGFNEARELISVEDYNLWIRVAASNWKIITCPRVLVHYTRGVGISSNSERFMRASLYNVDDIGSRLSLPDLTVRRKRNEIISDFGRKALYERDLVTARQLLRRAFRQQPSARNLWHALIASMPTAVLDVRRDTRRLLARHGAAHKVSRLPANAAPAFEMDDSLDAATSHASILDPAYHTPGMDQRLVRPMLITTVDAEEDFDWTRPFSRAETEVTSIRSQHRAHRIFERYGVIPTYMVDHPVASQDSGRAPLNELLRSGLCEIGAQLHPWVTPPFVESVSTHNSYPGNLPPALEFAKIKVLTEELAQAFGQPPRIFRAGRYGVGPNTGSALGQLGYEADSSVVPCWSFARQGGPDFRQINARPYWIDSERRILELPLTAAVVGRAEGMPSAVTSRFFGPYSETIGLPSLMSRLGLLERIKLTPEGITIEEARRLVSHMVRAGHKIFVLTYHSPSLEPGNTPYVRSDADLDRFLRWLDEFYDYFTREIGGVCASWRTVRSGLRDIVSDSASADALPCRPNRVRGHS